MCEIKMNYEFYSVWAQVSALHVRWANKHEISYPELMVLYALTTMGELTQKEICEGFGLLKQTVNTVIRDLKKKGYVILELSRTDRREKLVVLTKEGKEYSNAYIEPLLHVEERVYKRIGYERIMQSQETMEMFNILFEKEMERNW